MLQSRLIFPMPVSADLELKLSVQDFFLPLIMYFTQRMRLHSASLRFTFHSICNHSLKDNPWPCYLRSIFIHAFYQLFLFLYENESSMQILAAKRNIKKIELKTLLKEMKPKPLANRIPSNLLITYCKFKSQVYQQFHRAVLQHE